MSRRWKRAFTARAAGWWRREPLAPERLRSLSLGRVLVVRQHNQMGDMVCATPCFRAFRETWPAAKIALITAPVNEQVVRHNPHLDRIFLFDAGLWRRPWRFFRFLSAIRDFAPDLAVVLNSVSFSATSAFLALWSGARWVVGGDSRPFGSEVSARAYSLQLPSEPVVDQPAVVHSLAPLRAVGITTEDLSTVVVPAPAERRLAGQLAADLGSAGPFWALHPGAGKRQNLWPAERFAEAAQRATAAGHPVLVLHGPADRDALDRFQAALPAPVADAPPIVVAPALSVGEGAALIELADRFLCNDTGVMHVAGAVGTPTVALFGPTDPALWKPPADTVLALRAPRRESDPRGPEFGWLETLPVNTVWQAWSTLPRRRVSPNPA